MSYACASCDKPMEADKNSAANTYVCTDDFCGARAVIVESGTPGKQFRYDVPKVLPIPAKGDEKALRPKDEVSSVLVDGRVESNPSAGRALDVVEDLFPGGLERLLNTDAEKLAAEVIERERKRENE